MDAITQVHIAKAIAIIAHRGQTDKAGRPYIEHPAAVAASFKGEAEECAPFQIVAWLHDVLEDTDVTRDDLHEAGIDWMFISDVECVTHIENEPLDDYYARVLMGRRARAVKIADVRHNSDPRRLALLDNETQLRLTKKYAKALSVLLG